MELKLLQRFDNYFFANITYGKLRDAGIECYLRDENTVTIDPLLSNAIGGIKLEVAEPQFEIALSIMKESEEAYLNDIECPYCNKNGLTVEEKISNHNTFWSKLKNQIAYGQIATYHKKYRCKHCKGLLNEIPLSF